MLVSAMVPAHTDTRSPAAAVETENEELRASRTPVGIISALTVVNVAALKAGKGFRKPFDLFMEETVNFDINVNVKPKRERMKIGELAKKSGTSTRMLRYYESQGLLSSERGPNGYRQYRECDVERAKTVASLIQAGLPTRLIRVVLDAEERPDEWTDACDLAFTAILSDELSALDKKISCLNRSRATIHAYLERVGS